MKRIGIVLIGLLLLGGVGSVLARPEAASILRRTTTVSGSLTTSDSYRASGAVGQGVAGRSSSARYQATTGFFFPGQHGGVKDELWLPLLSR